MTTYADATPIVYVLDDDPIVRHGLENLLQSIGLMTMTFGSATEFLRTTRPQAPSCLILDVRLPGLSGLDFQTELSNLNIKIPVILISGYGDVPMTVRGIKAGAIEFLTKPIREQALLDAVNAALAQDRVQHEASAQAAELQARYATLSERERAVAMLVTSGKLNKQIADEIGLSEVTVKVHRRNAMKKLGAKSMADLVRMIDKVGDPPAN